MDRRYTAPPEQISADKEARYVTRDANFQRVIDPAHALGEAGYPLPDSASVEAAQRIMSLVSGLTVDDLLLCLMYSSTLRYYAARPFAR